MKALTRTQYGSTEVLHINEVEKPTPKANEVLVRVKAASVNAGDIHMLYGTPFPLRLMFGLFQPKIKILGVDIAGVVETVGSDVAKYQPGDEVFGDLSNSGFGAFAEFTCVHEDALAHKSASVSFEQSSSLPTAGATALQGLRDYGKIKAGDKVLVNGASGGVGSFAVQLAKHFGAEVTAVCSTRKMEMVRALGADRVIDYTKQDPTQTGDVYDLILDAAAFRHPREFASCLASKGRYVLAGGGLKPLLQLAWMNMWRSKKDGQTFQNFLVKVVPENLELLNDLLEQGAIRPYISKTYTLSETPEAIRAVENRQVQGKLAVSIS